MAGRLGGAFGTMYCPGNAPDGGCTNTFITGQKLSLVNPVVAIIHGHNHHVPEHTSWTCPSPYDSITLPHFSVGTPLYQSSPNGGDLHFTVFRLGSNWRELVGVGAPASAPTGPWTYTYI